MTHTEVIDKVSEDIKAMLAETELTVLTEGVTLASLIREGSAVSDQARDWTTEDGSVCALSAATAALRARKS